MAVSPDGRYAFALVFGASNEDNADPVFYRQPDVVVVDIRSAKRVSKPLCSSTESFSELRPGSLLEPNRLTHRNAKMEKLQLYFRLLPLENVCLTCHRG